MKTNVGITRSRLFYGIVVTGALVVLAEVILYSGWNVHLFHTIKGAREYPRLGVGDVLEYPARLAETIVVEGHVSAVDLSGGTFMMRGLRESDRLRVEYSGSLPALNDSVLVIGQLHRGKDPVLVAEEVELQ
jgi:hypothetical protein